MRSKAGRRGPGRSLLPRGTAFAVLACSISCTSISASETQTYPLGNAELAIAARAERGFTADRIHISVNGVDVAEGEFGAEQAAGTVLRGSFSGMPVEARCGHRWRPGLHIGYRCSVRIDGGDWVELAF